MSQGLQGLAGTDTCWGPHPSAAGFVVTLAYRSEGLPQASPDRIHPHCFHVLLKSGSLPCSSDPRSLHQIPRGSILETKGPEKPLSGHTDYQFSSPLDKELFPLPCTPGTLQSRIHALSCLPHAPRSLSILLSRSPRARPGPIVACKAAAASLWSLISRCPMAGLVLPPGSNFLPLSTLHLYRA